MTRPLVRYLGGKWLLAPWIVAHFPRHRVYVEPFGGGGSVLLRKPRSFAEVYNDLDGVMVNLFRVARDHGTELREALRLTPFSREEFYLSHRHSDDPVEMARRTVARSFMGFGSNCLTKHSGFRAHSNRSGSTPAHDWRNWIDAFDDIIDRLRGVVIEQRDAVRVMKAYDSAETLHYVDPPYTKSSRGDWTYYRHDMTDDDHARLAAALRGLQGGVIVSGYDSPLYRDLFSDWRVARKSALADGARRRTELLWMSPGIPDTSLFPHGLLGGPTNTP